MDAAGIIDTLTPLVPGAAFEAAASVDFPTIYVPPDRLVDTCRALRDTPSLRFEVIIEITAADYLPRHPRFEIVYHLLSVSNRQRVRLKVRASVDTPVPTVQGIWPGAGWPEREV
jgi:NADH-quinone oxidoreductase subunit C